MWVKQYQRFATIILLNLVFAAVAAAADEDSTAMPSMELLEFLGEFQTEDGEWIDPMELSDTDIEQSEKQRNDEDQSDE
jgi:hypothetical protein